MQTLIQWILETVSSFMRVMYQCFGVVVSLPLLLRFRQVKKKKLHSHSGAVIACLLFYFYGSTASGMVITHSPGYMLVTDIRDVDSKTVFDSVRRTYGLE
jgi:hypothetical protein